MIIGSTRGNNYLILNIVQILLNLIWNSDIGKSRFRARPGTLTVLLGKAYHSSRLAKIAYFSDDDWKTSHQYKSNKITIDTGIDFERHISNQLKSRDMTKPHYKSHAGYIYLVNIASELESVKDIHCYIILFSLCITNVSLLSSSVVHSRLAYYRSVECVSGCPL